MEGVKLESATFEFSQEGNCVDSGDIELLTIECKSDLGIDYTEGCFYVIRTQQWSFDSIEDIRGIIDRVSMILNK